MAVPILGNQATLLYANLPRNRRGELYQQVINNPNQPFHEGRDDTLLGHWVATATGDNPAPTAQLPLNAIIQQVAIIRGYNPAQINAMYQAYIDGIQAVLAGAPPPPPLPPFVHLPPPPPPAPVVLDVFAAPHIGNLGSPPIDPNHENSISGDRLVVGEDYVRIAGDNRFIYDPVTLQQWFDQGHNTNPLTNQPVNQGQLQRFTYTGPAAGGRRRRKTRGRKVKRNRRNRRKSHKKN